MIAARILEPASKLATARGLAEATAVARDDAWTRRRGRQRQGRIDARHLEECLVLYGPQSVSPGQARSFPAKKGKLQIEFGLLCNHGCPVSVEVFPGPPGRLAGRHGAGTLRAFTDRGIDRGAPCGPGLDQRPEGTGHPRPGGGRRRSCLSRGTAHGVPQSPAQELLEALLACRGDQARHAPSQGQGEAAAGRQIGKQGGEAHVVGVFYRDASISAEARLDGLYVIRTSRRANSTVRSG